MDQADFFLGKQAKSNRESVVVYVGNQLFGVKWRNWKMMLKEIDNGVEATRENGVRRFYISTLIRRKSIG